MSIGSERVSKGRAPGRQPGVPLCSDAPGHSRSWLLFSSFTLTMAPFDLLPALAIELVASALQRLSEGEESDPARRTLPLVCRSWAAALRLWPGRYEQVRRGCATAAAAAAGAPTSDVLAAVLSQCVPLLRPLRPTPGRSQSRPPTCLPRPTLWRLPTAAPCQALLGLASTQATPICCPGSKRTAAACGGSPSGCRAASAAAALRWLKMPSRRCSSPAPPAWRRCISSCGARRSWLATSGAEWRLWRVRLEGWRQGMEAGERRGLPCSLASPRASERCRHPPTAHRRARGSLPLPAPAPAHAVPGGQPAGQPSRKHRAGGARADGARRADGRTCTHPCHSPPLPSDATLSSCNPHRRQPSTTRWRAWQCSCAASACWSCRPRLRGCRACTACA